MNSESDAPSRFVWNKVSAFRVFKLVVFAALTVNLCIFLVEDVIAYLFLDPNALLGDVLEAFAVTIDYVAWMILIVLFEMETGAQVKSVLSGGRKWVIAGSTAVCYAVLVYAAYGFAVGLWDSYQFEPMESRTACDLAGGGYAYLNVKDRPVELTAGNCGDLSDAQLFRSPTDHLIATGPNLSAVQKLGWVELANAVAWLLIVLIFQIEILLQQAKKLTKHWLRVCTMAKGLLYFVLAINAVYWTIYGAFIDWWDAWLWLLAFVLIDLNLLGIEVAEAQAQPQTAPEQPNPLPAE